MPIGLREDISNANWLHLTNGEQVRWSGRPSRVTLLSAAAISILLVIASLALTIVFRPVVFGQGWPTAFAYLPLVIGVAGIAYGAYVYLNWLRLVYVITDEEIYVKVGLISRDVTQVPLDRVQNTAHDQTILQRLLSYGTIYVYTAGTHTDDLVFKDVPNPERVKATLTAHLKPDRGARRAGRGGI